MSPSNESSNASPPAVDWQTRVAQKQKSSRERIPKEWLLASSVLDSLKFPLEKHPNQLIKLDIPRTSGILTDRELSITEDYTVTALLEALASSKLSAVEVTTAFSKRAAIAGQLTNCLTETYFEEALQRAKQLDEIKAQGRLAGPLHGLPISMKDGFQLKGSEATIGFVANLGRMSEKNSPLVDILLELGAVIHVKTNIPMTLMTADSHNNIFGRTLNPHNTMLTAGGSSGGEGALVAFRGSPLGIGTDIAGSIRIPALCDGTYGFRPSSNRIPYAGQTSPGLPGYNFFLPVAGPLANDVHALKLLVKSVLQTTPARYDSVVHDVPWRDVQVKSKLRIGLLPEDPAFPCHPPVRRALNEAAKLVAAQGHEIVPLQASECHIRDLTEVSWLFFGQSARDTSAIEAAGEPLVPSILAVRELAAKIPPVVLADQPDVAGVAKVAALNVKRLNLQEAWRMLWNTHQLDAVLSPAAQHTAIPHDTYGVPPYTVFLNCLDYPACAIPFNKSSKELDSEPFKMGEGQYGPDYEPAATNGAPCSIQVFTSRMRDEECLEIARVVDACLHTK